MANIVNPYSLPNSPSNSLSKSSLNLDEENIKEQQIRGMLNEPSVQDQRQNYKQQQQQQQTLEEQKYNQRQNYKQQQPHQNLEDDENTVNLNIDLTYEYMKLRDYFSNNIKMDGKNDFSQITEHIFICNGQQAENQTNFLNNQIRSMIYISMIPPHPQYQKLYQKLNLNIDFIQLSDDDDSPIDNHFEKTYNFINKSLSESKNILITCDDGISRSSTILIAYYLRIYYNHITSWDIKRDPRSRLVFIIAFLIKRRPCVAPNYGFLRVLLLYENYLRKKILTN